jgi:predicted MFS family arabinose efflux permease
MALIYTAIGPMIAKAVSPRQRGLAMGMYNSSIYLGMMAGSTLFGIIIRRSGFFVGFTAGSMLAVAALLWFLYLMRRSFPSPVTEEGA